MQLPEIGEVVAGKYRIAEVLGEGGFGRVYRAVAELTERNVAVKVVKPGASGYELTRVRRFMRELRAVGKLESQYTLTLVDYGRTEHDVLFMVTEFVPGEDLAELLTRRGTLSERDATHIVMQVLHSLDEAHTRDILHRDIKPSNIRIYDYQGDPLSVKLLDFGLARSVRANEPRLTGTGKVVGTPKYMAPEQMLGHPLGPQTDVYSVGLVAYDMVLGAGVRRIGNPEVPEPGERLTPAMHELLSRMLEADPADRFDAAQAADFIHARRAEFSSTHSPGRAVTAAMGQASPTADALPATVEDAPVERLPQVYDALTPALEARPVAAEESARSPSRWPAVAAVAVLVGIGAILLGIMATRGEPVQPQPREDSNRVVEIPMDAERETELAVQPSAGCTAPSANDMSGVYHPSGYDPAKPLPAVVFHPVDGDNPPIPGFAEVADEERVLLFYPGRTWVRRTADDLEEQVRVFQNRFCVDLNRVYLVSSDPASRLCDGFAAAVLTPAAGMKASCDESIPVLHDLQAPAPDDASNFEFAKASWRFFSPLRKPQDRPTIGDVPVVPRVHDHEIGPLPVADGLELWLTADVIEPSRDGVQRWVDQSPNRRVFSMEHSEQRPQLHHDVLAGHPAVRFDGQHSLRHRTPISLREGTVLVVAKNLDPDHRGQILSNCAGTNNQVRYDGDDHIFVYAHEYRFKERIGGFRNLDRFSLLSFRLHDGWLHARQNGSTVEDVKVGRGGVWNIGQLGARCTTEYLHGYIAEAVIYERALADAELDDVERYLMAKYELERR